MTDIQPDSVTEILASRITNDFINPTLQDIEKEDFRIQLMAVGRIYREKMGKKNEFYRKILNGTEFLELKKMEIPDSSDTLMSIALSRINRNLQPKKYRCRVHIGASSNIYVFREIINLEV